MQKFMEAGRMKKYIIIALIAGMAAIVGGTVGVVYEVKSTHEVSARNTVIQDIPEDSSKELVSQNLQEKAKTDNTDGAGSGDNDQVSDPLGTIINSDNEIAIISPEGEVLAIEEVNVNENSSEVSNSAVVGNAAEETKQEDQSVAVTDGMADKDIIPSEDEAPAETDGQRAYETVRIPVG